MTEAKTYRVGTATGEVVEVNADRLSMDDSGIAITLYVGDDVVGSFRGFNSVHVVTPDASDPVEG